MQSYGLNELRKKFLDFFKSKGHIVLPSFSLVPQDDKSLLLINSGMAPLKPYFTGDENPPNKRVATCQKCIRTPDIENVGKTSRHATFFEMLGNFSFGDYFKEEAIMWSWEFVTKVLALPIDKLWITVYLDDDEAFKIWHEIIGLPEDRIVRMGKEDNFWEIGVGPCGPCSEIFYDMGEHRGCGESDCKIGCDCDRFIEFWNLVFTQFNRDEEGNYHPLAHPNIDTGMGLERIAAIMQDVDSIFEVDTIRNIIDAVCDLVNIQYGQDVDKDVSLRVVADHIRATTFMISDGILPSNEGRGYVLRRVLRRAARHGKLLGIEYMFLKNLAQVVIEESHEAYPELLERRDYILNIIEIEEKRFNATLDQGLNILYEYIEKLNKESKKILDGEHAFRLYDTYGFPLDLTKEILQEHNMDVDEGGFNKFMQAQREMARLSREATDFKGKDDSLSKLIDANIHTEFIGYNTLKSKSKIITIIKDKSLFHRTTKGDDVLIILDKTPFYAESGGQVGDRGVIKGQNGSEILVDDTQIISDDKILHYGRVTKGDFEVGQIVEAIVHEESRMSIARNHTCTHLLHEALKRVLGSHVEQAGSLVSSDRLRFDFSHFSALTQDEILDIEKLVNHEIYKSLSVQVIETSMNEARKLGAVALFGERYGENVRVIKIGDFSRELCGGTHVSTTSEIGMFKIISENGIAAGIRRIEAYTGLNVYEYMNNLESILFDTSQILKSNVQEIPMRVQNLFNDLKETNVELDSLRRDIALSSIDDIIKEKGEINGVSYIAVEVDGQDMNNLRNLSDMVKDKLKTGVVVLASGNNDKVSLIASATKDVIARGIHCGNLIREIAKDVGGGGGGRPDMAQAGGKDISGIDSALEKVSIIIGDQLKD
ncbi:MAG: alanine--tRNA ligase [Clostridiales bacterium]|nr:alanine--tRNA ligase [Clostridiales bacterium]